MFRPLLSHYEETSGNYTYTDTHTHIHTHIYIYIYIDVQVTVHRDNSYNKTN